MRIAINTLSAHSGAGVSMMGNLLSEIARTDAKNQYVVFYSLAQGGVVDAIPVRFKRIPVRYVPYSPYGRVLWEQFIFPFYLWRHHVDVFYSVGNTTSILAPCKIVLLMENANPYSKINLPWSFKDRARFALLRILGWLSARRATKIRFVSKNSRDLIVPQLRVPAEKCVVIPHGVSADNSRFDDSTIRNKLSNYPIIESSYILTIGANGPHRNTLRLLKAFSILTAKYGYNGDLVVIGNTGSRAWHAALDKLVQELNLSSRVVFKGEMPHRDVAAYFKNADAFVFSSLEETFGIPLLEAMAFGVPIAVSDCDLDPAYRGKCFNPFREICGDAMQYFNPFDPEDIAQCTHRIITDFALRAQLIAQGKERVKKYNLEDTARALVKLFDTIVSPP